MRRDYSVEEIISMEKDELWALPEGGLRIAFSNETKVCPTNVIKINWYFWQLFKFGDITNISSEFYMGEIDFNGGIPREEMANIFWAVFMHKVGGFFPGQGLDLVWELARRTYQIMNDLYNDTIFRMTEYVSTLDIEDLIEIIDNPAVIDAKAKWAKGEMETDEVHDINWRVIQESDTELSRGCRSGIFNRRQTNQTIGPRAFIPEVNGEAFTTPIGPGYIEGLDKQYDRLIESRTASIAYFMAKAPLEQSEYNNRMAQFLCASIRGVDHSDCGTKHTLSWRVKSKKDLKQLRGKFMVKDDGSYQMIYGTEKDLIGEMINIRSFTQCESHDPSRPCAICVGWNAWTTPPGTVLGHHLSTEPLARISQTILSTKHVISSTKPLFLVLDDQTAPFIYLSQDNGHEVMLREQEAESVMLRVARNEAFFINDVINAEDPDEIVESRISSIENIQLVIQRPGRSVAQVATIPVSLGGRGSPLAKDLLLYMREQAWDIIGSNIEVDLCNWDYSLPIIRTPKRGSDIMSVLYTFQDFVNSPHKPNAVCAVDYNHPTPAIEALMEGLSKHIAVNFNHIEVFVRALMCKKTPEGKVTYELPRAGEPFEFGCMKDIITNRSQGAAMAFEGHQSNFVNPSTYLKDGLDIPSTVLDYIWTD